MEQARRCMRLGGGVIWFNRSRGLSSGDFSSRRVAVVGSGPAGFYVTGSLQKLSPGVRVDVLERERVPFGLVRFGVAPDHPEVKNCTHQFEKYVAKSEGAVRFFGDVGLGRDVSVAALRGAYDAVILATGADEPRKLELPGEMSASNLIPAHYLVLWYNGHPGVTRIWGKSIGPLLSKAKTVAIPGMGNVALDVARILLTPPSLLQPYDIPEPVLEALKSSSVEKVILIGRRGPLQSAFTIKEFRELLRVPGLARPPRLGSPADFDGIDESLILDLPRPKRRITDLILKSHREGLEFLRSGGGSGTEGERSWEQLWNRSPVGLVTNRSGWVEALELGVNRMEGERAVETGETEELECDLVIPSLGYVSQSIPGVRGRVPPGRNPGEEAGLFAVGWAANGASGTIATTQADARSVAEAVSSYLDGLKTQTLGGLGIEDLLRMKKETASWRSWEEWKEQDAEEQRRGAKLGKLREKII